MVIFEALDHGSYLAKWLLWNRARGLFLNYCYILCQADTSRRARALIKLANKKKTANPTKAPLLFWEAVFKACCWGSWLALGKGKAGPQKGVQWVHALLTSRSGINPWEPSSWLSRKAIGDWKELRGPMALGQWDGRVPAVWLSGKSKSWIFLLASLSQTTVFRAKGYTWEQNSAPTRDVHG